MCVYSNTKHTTAEIIKFYKFAFSALPGLAIKGKNRETGFL